MRRKDGLPLTAPARTLVDLAGVLDDAELDRALSEARALRLVSDRGLQAALARAGARPGVGRLRALLASDDAAGFTRSRAEALLRRLVRDARLPMPLFNADVSGFEVDAFWPAQRLIVEVDGYASHGHRSAFEKDRRKGMALVAAGYVLVRITWRQLVDEPLVVVAALAQALAVGARHGRDTD